MKAEFQKILKCVQDVDLFGTQEFFRYKSSQNYRSLCGSIITILLVSALAFIFYQNILQYTQNPKIYTNQITVNSVDPPLLNISNNPKGKFMLAVAIDGLDLNSTTARYFDIRAFVRGWNVNHLDMNLSTSVEFRLQACNQSHWSDFPQLNASLNMLNISRMLCLPNNVTLSFQGRLYSKNYRRLEIQAFPCTSSFDTSRTCIAPDNRTAFLDAKLRKLQLYFTNIHPYSKINLRPSYFLDDRYSAIISNYRCQESNLYIQDYTITTTDGVNNFQYINPIVQKGALVQQPMITRTIYRFYQTFDGYAYIGISKSTYSKFVQRNFQTVDNTLASIGSLILLGCLCLFFVKQYNFTAYKIALGSQLFRSQPNQSRYFKRYNFLIYILQKIYNFFAMLRICPSWQRIQRYNYCERQVDKQLDSVYMMKKLGHFQTAISTLLHSHHIKGIYLRDKVTVAEVKQRRQFATLGKQVNFIKRKQIVRTDSLGIAEKINQNQGEIAQQVTPGFDQIDKNAQILEIEGIPQMKIVQKNEEIQGGQTNEQNKEIKQNQKIQENLQDGILVPLQQKSKKGQRTESAKGIQKQNDVKNKNAQDESKSEDMSSIFSDEAREHKKHEKVLLQMIKVKQQAKKGQRVSKKIMQITNSNIKALQKYRRSIKQQVGLDSPVNIPTPMVFGQSELIGQDQESSSVQKQNSGKSKENIQNEGEGNKKDEDQNAVYLLNEEKRCFLARVIKRMIRFLCDLIKSFDYLHSADFWRYKSRTSYNSTLGGIISVMILLALALMLSLRLYQWFTFASTSTSVQKISNLNPGAMNISTYPLSNFMALVRIQPLASSWNKTLRHFDIFLQTKNRILNLTTGVWNQTVINYPLKNCTNQSWAFMPQILNYFNVSNYLCFPMNKRFQIKGTKNSNQIKTLQLVIKKCTKEMDPSIPCSNDTTNTFYSNGQNLNVTFYITNPKISTDGSDYLDYYLDDKVYGTLALKFFTQIDFDMEEYTINTDQSILPTSILPIQPDILTEKGAMFTKYPNVMNRYNDTLQVANTSDFFRAKFWRSPRSRIFSRTPRRISQILAFIGGLFGFITTSLFILTCYNNFAYEIQIGSNLFKSKKSSFKEYNFFSFIKQNIYKFISLFGFQPKWKSTIQLIHCQQETEKQLDVLELIERFQFIQSAIETVLQQNEVKMLHLKQRPTLPDAKKHRKQVKIKRYIQRKFNKRFLAQYGYEPKDMDYETDSQKSDDEYYNKNQILTELAMIKISAKKGEKLSQKIMKLTTNTFGAILPDQSTPIAKQVNEEKSEMRHNSIQSFNLSTFEINDEDQIESTDSNFNPLRTQKSRVSKIMK